MENRNKHLPEKNIIKGTYNVVTTVVPDLDQVNTFRYTTTENITISNPKNLADGCYIRIEVASVAGKTVSFGDKYHVNGVEIATNMITADTSIIYEGFYNQDSDTLNLILVSNPYTPPAVESTLFWLDGTVDGDEFVDKSGNGRNFTITGKDFTASYFPYKSAATISAPVGDATLIAADINNFLYDSGGDPNEIPVVSFFQNIDYEDKLFCRHIAQVTDGNGVETTEPSVKDIVLYDAALTGGDLTTANSYYGVPTEVTSNVKWVTPDGNDTTGDGSKLTPWLTLDKAVDSVNNGDLIYVQSNIYPGDGALGYLYNPNDNSIYGLGLVEVLNAHASYPVRIRNAPPDLAHRLIFRDVGTTAGAYFQSAENCEINNVYIKPQNTVSYVLYNAFKQIKDSVLYGTASSRLIDVAFGTNNFNIESNLIQSLSAVIGYENIDGLGNGIILNNKFKGAYTTLINHLNTNGTLLVKGNSFDSVDAAEIFKTTVDIGKLTFTRNTLILGTISGSILDLTDADAIQHEISYNQVAISSGFFANLTDCQSIFNDNIINNSGGSSEINMLISAAGAKTLQANNNRIESVNATGYHIATGAEVTSAGDAVAVIQINNNYIKGLSATTPVDANATHGLFAGFQENIEIRYNFIWGSGYGFVIKGSTGIDLTGTGVTHSIFKDSKIGGLIKGAFAVDVINNTFFQKTLTPTSGIIDMRVNVGSDDPDNCVIKNNIFIMLGTGDNYAIKMSAAGSNACDYNFYYCPNGTLKFEIAAADKTWAEWQSAGFDANGKVLTDEEYAGLFTDADNGDYSLPTGSAAIGAGETLAAAYDDGLDASTDWGDENTLPAVVTRQQIPGSWDIGAYISRR